jgi:hypothetical protein
MAIKMIKLNNPTIDIKPLTEKNIHVSSDLLMFDAYDSEDTKDISVKHGYWQAQALFFDYPDLLKSRLMRLWAARLAHAFVYSDESASNFEFLMNISKLETQVSKVKGNVLEMDFFNDNEQKLKKVFNGIASGFDHTDSDIIAVLKMVSNIISETKGFFVYSFTRSTLSLFENPQVEIDRDADLELIQAVRQYVNRCCEFENDFLNSVASKGIQLIQLKHADISSFTSLSSTNWVGGEHFATTSGRLGLVVEDWYLQQCQSSVISAIEDLTIEYRSVESTRLPSNFKKVGVDSFGLGSVTLHRDSPNEIYYVYNEANEIVEIAISFDTQYTYEDD